VTAGADADPPPRTAADDGPALALRAALDASARIERTRCGAGAMIWRRWGSGRPLVLLHGGAGGWDHWVRNVGPLSRVREVWCADLPSLGESADAPEPGDVHAIAATVADGLDALLPGPRAFDLAGFSFGALIGTLVASARPGRVDRLVLVGAASLGLPDPEIPLRFWRRSRDPATQRAIHRANLHALMLAGGADDPDAVTMHAANAGRARFFGKAVAARPLIRERVGALDVGRVDAIYGALDAITRRDADTARAVLQAARPGLRFEAVPGAGHWVQYERAAAFEAALARMLGEDRAA
jgi:pimeloyl-ACP methyl ester carboxylesterase